MVAVSSEVFVVDDELDVRRALERLITSAGYAVRTFSNASDVLENLRKLRPSCLVLDMRLPDLDGIEVLRRVRGEDGFPPVIVMSGFGDVPTSVEAMKSGALDFLVKPVMADSLLAAIERAFVFGAKDRDKRTQKEELSRRYESLTRREVQVYELVLAGRLNKQIARELQISEKTVKVHRGRVMTKMGVRRLAQLVQSAVRLGQPAS